MTPTPPMRRPTPSGGWGFPTRERRAVLRAVSWHLLVVGLALGTAPLEVATATAGLVGLAAGDPHRARPWLLPWALFVLALAWPSALGTEGFEVHGLLAALGHGWAWSPVLLLPMLGPPDHRAIGTGLVAAGLLALGAVGQAAVHGVGAEVRGLFSHHLTLGYALLPPLAAGLAARRWFWTSAMALGVLATGAWGPVLGLGVIVLAQGVRPGVAGAAGVGLLLAVLAWAPPAWFPELHDRQVLWTAGTEVLILHPAGAGLPMAHAWTTLTQAHLEPGYFVNSHAHDAGLELGSVGGMATWLALAWLLGRLWRQTERPGRAALAALVVGGLTQDTWGDLEVLRAALIWGMLGTTGALSLSEVGHDSPGNRREPDGVPASPRLGAGGVTDAGGASDAGGANDPGGASDARGATGLG